MRTAFVGRAEVRQPGRRATLKATSSTHTSDQLVALDDRAFACGLVSYGRRSRPFGGSHFTCPFRFNQASDTQMMEAIEPFLFRCQLAEQMLTKRVFLGR